MPRRKKGIKGRGSVFPRKDGRWVAQFIVEETGEQKQLYAKTEKEAWEKLDKALQEQKQGVLATGPNQKLGDYLNWWLEEVHKHKLRLSTYTRYRGLLDKHILPELGQIQLRKLTSQRIQTFYNKKLKEKQAPGSVHNIHKVLHGGLKRAVKLRYLSYNPADGVSLPSAEPLRKGQSLTLEQARHLLRVARGHRLEAFIALTLTTGMRLGELIALRWSDITFGTETEIGSISINHTVSYITRHGFVENEPKTKASERAVPLIPAVARLLIAHRQRQDEVRQQAGKAWKEHDLVFSNRLGGFLLSTNTREEFYRLLDKANNTPNESGELLSLPDIHIHDLRHTASTLWQSLGISEKVAQEWLGHSSLEMTRFVYTHVIPSWQKEAAERINALF
jgi:integrase